MDAKVKSLDKALRILNCFTVDEPELGITELSKQLDLYKSNVHNIIATFEKNGFIEQNPQTGKYRLSLGILRLSHVVTSSQNAQDIIHRYVTELSAKFNEIVYFGVFYNEQVMYLDGAYPDQIYNFRWGAGMVAPLTCTSIGKAILAFSDESVISRVLEKPMKRFTDSTITDPQLLREDLKRTRERGYSTDNMEHEYGVKCVGVPVYNRGGELIGALSTTGPSLRFNEERTSYCARILKEAALAIRNSI